MREESFITLTQDMLRSGHSIRFRPQGRSMRPTIEDSEPVLVAPVIPSHLRIGDIILYRAKQGVIAHRVWRIKQQTASAGRIFITRGDAALMCDAPVPETEIIGQVVAIERDGRNLPLSGWGHRLSYRAWRTASYVKEIAKCFLVFVGLRDKAGIVSTDEHG